MGADVEKVRSLYEAYSYSRTLQPAAALFRSLERSLALRSGSEVAKLTRNIRTNLLQLDLYRNGEQENPKLSDLGSSDACLTEKKVARPPGYRLAYI